MTNLLVLMCLYLSYSAVSFWLFNCNFLSPSFVFSLSMSLMLCLAYYSAQNLGMLLAINLRTFSIFAFAGFVFIAAEFLVYAMNTVNVLNRNYSRQLNKYQPLIVNLKIQYLFTILLVVSLLAALRVLFINTGGSWQQRMQAYKQLMLYNADRVQGRFLVAQLYKINYSAISLFGYILVYNLTVCGLPLKEVWVYIADVAIYAVFSAIYNGGRQTAIETMLYLIMIYIALNMNPGGRRKIYRFIRKIIPILVLSACLFTVTGTLVGRYETQKSSLVNFAEYICGGLYSFNLHIDEGASTKYFGQSSFSYIYSTLHFTGLIPADIDVMSYSSFDLYGNTVTIFGRWYRDFGTVGVFVMTLLVSIFYSRLFYGKIIYSSNVIHEHHLARIFYCQFLTGLIWAGYDDRIASLMTTQTIMLLVFTAVLYKLLLRKRI